MKADIVKNILYISFLGILDPVGFSQIFSYIVKLSEDKQLKFTLLTFEKMTFLKRKDYLQYEELQKELCRNNVDWYVLRHHSGIGKVYDIFLGFIYAIFLTLKKKINIIHARSNEPIVLAFFISRVLKTKIIYDRRGMMADDYSDDATTNFKFKKGGFIYKFVNRFERQIMLSSDAIVVLTNRILNYLTKDTYFKKGKNIFVIPCCVDLNRFDKFIKRESILLSELHVKDRFVFNYTGSLCNLHSFSEMLDFFKIAKKVIPNAHFIFLTLVDRRIIEQHINFKGLDTKDFTIISTSPLRVNEYLSLCDVSVMFFKPTFIRWAASPTKFAECLASGLPIIINKGMGDTEGLIEKNRVGAVVEDFSETAYLKALDKMLNLLKGPDIRLRCRKTAESEFSLQYGVGRYKNIYGNL